MLLSSTALFFFSLVLLPVETFRIPGDVIGGVVFPYLSLVFVHYNVKPNGCRLGQLQITMTERVKIVQCDKGP